MAGATDADNAGGVVDAPSMTDEEMLESVYVPPEAVEQVATVETVEVPPAKEEEQQKQVVEQEKVEIPPVADPEINPLSDDEVLNGKKPESAAEPKKEEATAPELGADGKPIEKPAVVEEQKPVDYKAFHDEIMAPFKANGKTIELRSPEEALQLMKQGANYTRKMQEIAPYRKMVTMLQKNEVNEDRLSFLIDLDKKNPEAVKQLIKEANIDPLDIDVTIPTAYQAGNHKVSDDEVKFRAVLDAVIATPEGKETLQVMNVGWDQASKDILWSSPEVMEVIHEQRLSGVYQQVASEIERQITLGNIKAGTPFLESYRAVGTLMGEQGLLKGVTPVKPTQAAPAPVAPVATKVAAPKPVTANKQQVAAAAVTRTNGKRPTPVTNLADLSDDAFMKNFAGRL